MSKRPARPDPLRRLAALYARMDLEYDRVTGALDFSCAGCPQNCCVSYFQHHTHIEWAYAFVGLAALDPDRREEFLVRAGENVRLCAEALTRGERPRVMCPLNQDGLCGLYDHRLMICRLHGAPHLLTGPDGRGARYPGCFRLEESLAARPDLASAPPHLAHLVRDRTPFVDRTPLYRELAELEMRFLGQDPRNLPRVNMTLAEMLVSGPPPVKI